MSESRVVGLGRRRSRSEAERLVLEFEQSGMTRSAFCQAHEVKAHTLDYYRRKLRGRAEGVPQLLPVELVGTCARGVSPVGAAAGGVGERSADCGGRRFQRIAVEACCGGVGGLSGVRGWARRRAFTSLLGRRTCARASMGWRVWFGSGWTVIRPAAISSCSRMRVATV